MFRDRTVGLGRHSQWLKWARTQGFEGNAVPGPQKWYYRYVFLGPILTSSRWERTFQYCVPISNALLCSVRFGLVKYRFATFLD